MAYLDLVALEADVPSRPESLALCWGQCEAANVFSRQQSPKKG